MKLVLDTVILVRGLMGPQGRQGQLLFDHGEAYTWITSADIVNEYLDVLTRPELQHRFERLGTRRRDILLRQIADSTRVQPAAIPRICRDSHDDKFLAAAIAGGVDYVVSEDLDLLTLGAYEGISICNTTMMISILTGIDISQNDTL